MSATTWVSERAIALLYCSARQVSSSATNYQPEGGLGLCAKQNTRACSMSIALSPWIFDNNCSSVHSLATNLRISNTSTAQTLRGWMSATTCRNVSSNFACALAVRCPYFELGKDATSFTTTVNLFREVLTALDSFISLSAFSLSAFSPQPFVKDFGSARIWADKLTDTLSYSIYRLSVSQKTYTFIKRTSKQTTDTTPNTT